MADSFTSLRRACRRDDVRWYYACRLRSLGWLVIELLAHADVQTSGLVAVARTREPRFGGMNLSETRR